MLWCGGAQAFFAAPQLERAERRVDVELSPVSARVTIEQVIKNPTGSAQALQWVSPLPAAVTVHGFFVNAEGTPYQLRDHDTRVESLWNLAAEARDARFFRLGIDPWDQLLISDPLTVEAGEDVRIKIVYDSPVVKVDKFLGTEVFLDDGIVDGLFELTVSLANDVPIRHVVSSLPRDVVAERTDRTLVSLWRENEWFAPENFWLLWSGSESPELRYGGVGGEYVGHFRSWPPAQPTEEVLVLIDRSGSMSGEAWYRVREWVRFVIEQLAGEIPIRVAFFDTDFEFLNKNFEQREEVLQSAVEAVALTKPVGATDFNAVVLAVADAGWTVDPERRLVVLITDSAGEADLQKIPELPARVAVLAFESEATFSLRSLARSTGGFFQKLFRTSSGDGAEQSLRSNWESLRVPLVSDDVTIADGEQELLPRRIQEFSTTASPIFVGRVPESRKVEGAYFSKFLSRRWAERQIVELLESGTVAGAFSDWQLDAVLAVGRTFGVRTPVFGPNTTRAELRKTVMDPAQGEVLQRVLWTLEQGTAADGSVRMLESVPQYQEADGVWRQYDFLDRAKPEWVVRIAPFSDAQRRLWLDFSEIVGAGFGSGVETEFCGMLRCFSVREGQRTSFEPGDRALLRDFDPNHWANSYLATLVQRGILTPEKNGKLYPNRAIDRGEFSRMLVQWVRGKNFTVSGDVTTFDDVESDTPEGKAVAVLQNENVVRGYADGSFRPRQDLTRAEAVKMLLAFTGWNPGEDTEQLFVDAAGWERQWVNEASRREIVRGYGDGSFRPGNALTRAEASKILVEWGRE